MSNVIQKDLNFIFKQKSQDFIVEEDLPFELNGKGDVLFVFFEKRNLNTMDVIKYLCDRFNASRMSFGVAGLKDKKAIARQWISVYQSFLKKAGGVDVFLNELSKIVAILKVDWHNKPIGMTTLINNTFYIRLRENSKLSQEKKEIFKKKIDNILQKGFPNFFGEQRFGINGRNRFQGKNYIFNNIEHFKMPKDKQEITFKVQAYASKMFNEYATSRLKKGLVLIDGDIVFVGDDKTIGIYDIKNDNIKLRDNDIVLSKDDAIVTGPVLGDNLLMPDAKTDSGKREIAFLQSRSITNKVFNVFTKLGVFGLRRSIRVYPKKTKLTYQKGDLLMKFSLPSGSYASVLIDEILSVI